RIYVYPPASVRRRSRPRASFSLEPSPMTDDHLYRRGVGVMLLNSEDLVFVGRRIDNRDEAWQMPQGGIDEGEDSWAAALREVEEETGIKPKLVERIACHPQQLRYDIPDAIASRLWGGKW